MKKSVKRKDTLDRTTPKRTIVKVRQTIQSRLKQIKKSRLWLAEQIKVRPATVYDFFNRGTAAKVETIEKMLGVLGLEIRPKE